jgi:hypothetical protein
MPLYALYGSEIFVQLRVFFVSFVQQPTVNFTVVHSVLTEEHSGTIKNLYVLICLIWFKKIFVKLRVFFAPFVQ